MCWPIMIDCNINRSHFTNFIRGKFTLKHVHVSDTWSVSLSARGHSLNGANTTRIAHSAYTCPRLFLKIKERCKLQNRFGKTKNLVTLSVFPPIIHSTCKLHSIISYQMFFVVLGIIFQSHTKQQFWYLCTKIYILFLLLLIKF